jgi:hypothetical protein
MSAYKSARGGRGPMVAQVDDDDEEEDESD